MQLQLKADVETILEYPVGERRRVDQSVGRRQQDRAQGIEPALADRCVRPLVVGARGDDDLDLVPGGEQGQVFPAIPGALAGSGRLEVHDPRHPRVDFGDVERPRGFERHLVAGYPLAGLAFGIDEAGHVLAVDLLGKEHFAFQGPVQYDDAPCLVPARQVQPPRQALPGILPARIPEYALDVALDVLGQAQLEQIRLSALLAGS